MEAITLALAVILVGGAFDPYRPINESMDLPFRLAVANTLSIRLRPSASINLKVEVGIKPAAKPPSEATELGVSTF